MTLDYERRQGAVWTALRRSDLARSLAMSALIALGAQTSVALPFTDVPVSLQLFFVLIAGGLLGARWGTAAVAEYLAMGLAGAPMFAQGRFGPSVLFGPTGGYLVGFLPAALLVGWVVDRTTSRAWIACSMGAAVTIVHLFGMTGWELWHRAPWPSVLGMATVPFLAVDALKAGVAWGLVTAARRPRA